MQFRALNSASNLYRRKLCPGSRNAEDGLPEFSPNTNQQFGKDLHLKEEEGEESWDDTPQSQKRALEKNQRLSNEFVATRFEELGITDPGPCRVFKEREFFLSDARGEPINPPVPGHADEVRWYPKIKTGFVFDSKFGRKPVAKAEMNYQLRVYFVQCMDDIGGERWYCAIRQPYLHEPDDFHSVEYLAEHLEIARQEVLRIVAETYKPDAKRCSSIDACTYCKAQGNPTRCPESLEFIRSVKLDEIKALNPEQLESLADDIKMADNVIKAWDDRMHQIAELYPDALKLYTLGKQQFTDKVTDVAAAHDRLADKFESADEFMGSCCSVSLPRLRVALSEKMDLTEDAAKEKVCEILGQQKEGEDFVPGALIYSKLKKRSLIRRKK